MIGDVLYLTGELVRLVRAQELEKATRLVAEAQRGARSSDLGSRQDNVHKITLNIAELRRQRDNLQGAISVLPETERFLARVQIEEIYRHLFDGEIASLQTRKRQLSTPIR